MTAEEIHEKLEQLALPLLAKAEIDLVELQVSLRGQDAIIRFMADKPAGGITIGECAGLNKAIVEAIDTDGFLGENYELEFSSPGLDRPLSTYKDFARNLNRGVHFVLGSSLDGKKEFIGIVTEVAEWTVTVATKKKKQQVVRLSQIIRAVLVI